MKKKMAIYGCGNMAQALIKGIHLSNKDIEFHTYTPSHKRALDLADAVKGNAYKSLDDIPECDYYLIACKPQQVESLATDLRGKISSEKVLISILAGTSSDKLLEYFSLKKVIRIMPNTPCLVAEGVSLLFATDSVDRDDLKYIQKLIESVSKVYLLKTESKIDDYVGISGSGPAYLFEIARILAAKGELLGLEAIDAKNMANQMLYGASKLLNESDLDAETLRNNVTSKNGVTFEALETLKTFELEKAFFTALDNAKQRSIELR